MSGNIQNLMPGLMPIDYSQYNTRPQHHENSSEVIRLKGHALNCNPVNFILPEDALILDRSGSTSSQIMGGAPLLRTPKITKDNAELHAEAFKYASIAMQDYNTDRPAGHQQNTPTSALEGQDNGLIINKKNAHEKIDWSNFSAWLSKIINNLIKQIELLMKFKRASTEDKNAGLTRQTAAAESSAKELVNSAKSSLTGAAVAGAASTGLTVGVLAKSAHTTHKHTTEHSKQMDDKFALKQDENKINNARSNPGRTEGQTPAEKAEAAAACKNAENKTSTKALQHKTDQKLYNGNESYSEERRKQSAALSLATPLHQLVLSSFNVKSTSQQADSNLLDNDRAVHQRSAENSAEMESRNHKVEQFVLDSVLQYINNNISTNSAVISRAN